MPSSYIPLGPRSPADEPDPYFPRLDKESRIVLLPSDGGRRKIVRIKGVRLLKQNREEAASEALQFPWQGVMTLTAERIIVDFEIFVGTLRRTPNYWVGHMYYPWLSFLTYYERPSKLRLFTPYMSLKSAPSRRLILELGVLVGESTPVAEDITHLCADWWLSREAGLDKDGQERVRALKTSRLSRPESDKYGEVRFPFFRTPSRTDRLLPFSS